MESLHLWTQSSETYVGALSKPSDGWPRFIGIDMMETFSRNNATALLMLIYNNQWI
jgi:hypothetical protein